jgi:hypothetical protein
MHRKADATPPWNTRYPPVQVGAVAISTDIQADLHVLLNSQYSVPSEQQGGHPGPSVERTTILTKVNASIRFDFSLLNGIRATSDHRFLLKGNANADDIQRRLQAQFTDPVYSIRSVRRECEFRRQERAKLHNDPKSGRPPIDFIGTKILSALERAISFCVLTRRDRACSSFNN